MVTSAVIMSGMNPGVLRSPKYHFHTSASIQISVFFPILNHVYVSFMFHYVGGWGVKNIVCVLSCFSYCESLYCDFGFEV